MAKVEKQEDTDPRHLDRAAELQRQADVQAALGAEGDRQAAEAAKALADQAYYEVHGIRRTEGKP